MSILISTEAFSRAHADVNRTRKQRTQRKGEDVRGVLLFLETWPPASHYACSEQQHRGNPNLALVSLHLNIPDKFIETETCLYFTCIILFLMLVIIASNDSRCFRNFIFPRKDSLLLMGDGFQLKKFIVLKSCAQWPTSCFRALTRPRVVPKRHTLSRITVFAPCFCSFYCALTRYRMLWLQPWFLIIPGAFRKKQMPRLQPQSSDSGSREAQALGLEPLGWFWGEPALRTTVCQLLNMHRREPKVLSWPPRPYTINPGHLSLTPCSPHSRHGSLFAVIRHTNHIPISGIRPC